MSDSTFNGVEVNKFVGGFSWNPLQDDQMVKKAIHVFRPDPEHKGQWLAVPKTWTWGSRYGLLDPSLGLDPETYIVRLTSSRVRPEEGGLEFGLARFLELACWHPKTIFGWDNDRDNGPNQPRGGEVNTGEYRPILAWMGETNLRLRRIKRPRFLKGLEDQVWLQSLRDWFKRTTSQFVTCDEEGVTVMEQVLSAQPGTKAVLSHTDQFGSLVARNGFEFEVAPKLDKRAKPLTNLSGFCARFMKYEVKLTIVDRVSDGALRISRKLAEAIIGDGDDPHHRRGQKALAFEIRAYLPEGLLKGIAVVDDTLEGLQIMTDVRNLKPGVSCPDQVVITLEPKEAKAFSRLHVQYWMTHAWLFEGERLKDAIFTEAYEVFKSIQDGSLDADLEACMKARTGRFQTDQETSVYLQAQWAMWEWKHLGLVLKHSWGLTTFVFQSHLKFLVNNRAGKLNPKAPCSLRCQPFGETFARSAGLYDGDPIGYDEARVCNFGTNKYPCVVLSDERYAEMCPVHGTSDDDDVFDFFFRTLEGQKKIVCLRTPCGPGEFTVLNYHEGDFAPVSKLYHWNREKDRVLPYTVEFPEVTSEISMPPRSGQAEIENRLGQTQARRTTEYGLAWLLESAERAASALGIGGLSNLLMCWASAWGGEGPEDQLAELSDLIDVMQSGGDKRQAKLLDDWLSTHWLKLNEDIATNPDVDRFLWNKRARNWVKNPQTGKWQQLHRFSEEEVTTSRWWQAMQYADEVLALFLGDDDQDGKLVEWMRGHYEPHGVFETLASFESEEDLEEGRKVLRELRKEMAEIEQRFELHHKDTPEIRKAKEEGRKEAYVKFDPKLEAALMADDAKLLIPVAVEIYRGQSKTHRDGSLFANPRIRKAFLSRVAEAMPVWKEDLEAQAEVEQATEAEAAQFEF